MAWGLVHKTGAYISLKPDTPDSSLSNKDRAPDLSWRVKVRGEGLPDTIKHLSSRTCSITTLYTIDHVF